MTETGLKLLTVELKHQLKKSTHVARPCYEVHGTVGLVSDHVTGNLLTKIGSCNLDPSSTSETRQGYLHTSPTRYQLSLNRRCVPVTTLNFATSINLRGAITLLPQLVNSTWFQCKETSLPHLLEFQGLYTQGSRPGRNFGESVGGMSEMDSSDWSTGIRYHTFGTKSDTECKPPLPLLLCACSDTRVCHHTQVNPATRRCSS